MPLPPDDGGGVLSDCAYSQAGDRMATCSSSGGVRIWDTSSGGGGEPALLHSEKVGRL
jgi:WD40 repeat protein